MNGIPNPLIHAAPAQIPDHRGFDLIVSWVWSFRQQRCCRHDLPTLAVSALRHLLSDPRQLHRMCVLRRKPLDGCDLLRADRRDCSLAGTHCLAIKMNRACSTQSHPAAVFRACKVEFVAQYPQQRRIGSDFNLVWTVVDHKMNRSHGKLPEQVLALDEATPTRFARATTTPSQSPLSS